MTALSAGERAKLVKVLGLLASSHDGERAAAALLATRIIQSAKLGWDELLQPQSCSSAGPPSARSPVPMTDMGLCIQHLRQLSEWEQGFISSVRGRALLTLAQRHKLTQIATKLRKAGAA